MDPQVSARTAVLEPTPSGGCTAPTQVDASPAKPLGGYFDAAQAAADVFSPGPGSALQAGSAAGAGSPELFGLDAPEPGSPGFQSSL